MSIQYITKDITTATDGVLLNGVNCQQQMGAGVALAYLKKWPIVKEQYLATEPVLGKTDMVTIVPDQLYVANCYTQRYFGSGGRKYASLGAITECLDESFSFAEAMGLDLYTPKIGCGLGGLDWDTEVAPIVERLSEKYTVTTFVCVI
jgi:O-acetyl-ADP-ribose deacetylase (regulator of RNase III)